MSLLEDELNKSMACQTEQEIHMWVSGNQGRGSEVRSAGTGTEQVMRIRPATTQLNSPTLADRRQITPNDE
jgi:hypothetical protein